MYGAPKIDKHFILSRVSEQQIMEHYLGVPVVVDGKMIKSPLRHDQEPTCGFTIDRRGVLKFKDFAGHFHGDCFNVVEKMFSCDFKRALEIIARDFNLRLREALPERVEQLAQLESERLPKTRKVIEVRRQRWTRVDKAFWSGFGIRSATLNKYHVASISHAWIDGKIFYVYSEQDPGYVYYYGDGSYKLYFPFRDTHRFVTNDASVLQGLDQLPLSGDLLLITKSYKDVMLLSQSNIPAVAPAAESVILSNHHFTQLSFRFRRLYSLYDFDYAGIKGANKMKRQLDIAPLFLTNGRFGSVDYQAKDVSDFYKIHGQEMYDLLIDLNLSIHERHAKSTANQPPALPF